MTKRTHILHLAIMFFLTHQATSNSNQYCPMQCTCKVIMDLLVANCSGQRLIEPISDMPASIELLDLSHNDITSIDRTCFSELKYLRILQLDHNSISFIELEAFGALGLLESVNLSNNRLEWLDNRLFEQNRQLTRVNLSGNKFMELPNEPILRSKSIQAVDLHKSQLTHLHVRYFEDLPNVRTIDLSGNLLIVLNLAAFATNNVLRHVDLRSNRIRCDTQFEMSTVWMKRNQINVLNDNCREPRVDTVTSVSRKSQRLQALTSINGSDSSSMQPNKNTNHSSGLNGTGTPSKNVNHRGYSRIPVLNKKCADNETDSHACHLFETCASSLVLLLEEVENKLVRSSDNLKSHCGAPQSLDDIINVRVAFYSGFILGTIIGVIVLYVVKLLCVCLFVSLCGTKEQKRRRRQNQASEIRSGDNTPEIIAENYAHNEAVSRISHRNADYGPLVPANNRRSQPPSRSFLAIFSERPIHRRYYQGATNLVRRISQSRLFLNSSRAQRNEHQRTREPINQNENRAPQTPPMPRTPSIEYIMSDNRYSHRVRDAIERENVVINDDDDMGIDTVDVDEIDEVELSQQPLNSSISVRSLNVCGVSRADNEHQRNSIRVVASAIDLASSVERSETPPPPYTYAVNN